QDRVACTGILVKDTLRAAPALGGLIVWLMYCVGRRFTRDGPAALAAGLLGLGTQLTAYAGIMTSYSHVYDAFWAALTVLASLRAAERPRAILRWALAGICIGIGVLQRPVSIAYAAIPVALALASLRRQRLPIVLAIGAIGAGTFLF